MAEEIFMGWQEYETEVFKLLKSYYPNGKIKKDVKLLGNLSKTERQIDILIEDHLPTEKIRVVVECKQYSRKLHVKDVEAFIGLVRDVGAGRGIMLTNYGYSEAAINRAFNEEIEFELDVINFDELREVQTNLVAMFFIGEYKLILFPPLGWIVDGWDAVRSGHHATMYQRGLDLKAAWKNGEWMEIDILNKPFPRFEFEQFALMHERRLKTLYPTATISCEDSILRDNEQTILYIASRPEIDDLAIYGFINFSHKVVSVTLFTKKQMQPKNLKKIKHVIGTLQLEYKLIITNL